MNDPREGAHDDIPELEDIVETAPAVKPAPPPNLDLFASPADLDALRERVLMELRPALEELTVTLEAEFRETLRRQGEALLEEKLPEILARAFERH
ncbi:MAG TPA: hypothetical protein VKZ99_02465 [Gammaproteobacteria bacterium]|nr:hypothetical protein [Gammaproteobacteria bacterium]